MSDPIAEALARCATLPRHAVEQLFARYGRPLEDGDVALQPSVRIDDLEVGRLSHRSPVDVIANDHFVMRSPDETLAMPGPLFAAAIAALTRPKT